MPPPGGQHSRQRGEHSAQRDQHSGPREQQVQRSSEAGGGGLLSEEQKRAQRSCLARRGPGRSRPSFPRPSFPLVQTGLLAPYPVGSAFLQRLLCLSTLRRGGTDSGRPSGHRTCPITAPFPLGLSVRPPSAQASPPSVPQSPRLPPSRATAHVSPGAVSLPPTFSSSPALPPLLLSPVPGPRFWILGYQSSG